VSTPDKGLSYVQQARDEQQQYSSALLRENEKLRATVATLESDLRRVSDQNRNSVEELDRLRTHLEDVALENQRYAEQYHQVESHSSNLANLYVASYQLHTSVDRDTVLNVIKEIVINLIGSEELAIYERNGDAEFRLADSFGVDADRLVTFIPGGGPVGQKLSEGAVFADPTASYGLRKLTACIPLKVGEKVTGAILIFSLLEHKPSLQPVDFELFDLLAVHAATSLYCASLHSQVAVSA
jgi:hypothetical protein